MSQELKPQNRGRGERHSAAWGKRLTMVLLLVVAEAAFAQSQRGKFAAELLPAVARAHQGTAGNETVQVIVQYQLAPQSQQEGKVQRLGARLNHRLSMVKGIALTIPVNALPALEADPEVVSVSIDHPMTRLDDITDIATGITAAWNAGYNGTGVAWP
jgi:DNA-binding transcriptional regulator YdaS (Cro superfamily)